MSHSFVRLTLAVFSVYCHRCNRALQESHYCSNCRVYGFRCALCHVAVRGKHLLNAFSLIMILKLLSIMWTWRTHTTYVGMV